MYSCFAFYDAPPCWQLCHVNCHYSFVLALERLAKIVVRWYAAISSPRQHRQCIGIQSPCDAVPSFCRGLDGWGRRSTDVETGWRRWTTRSEMREACPMDRA
eukprot:scaffold248337_cov63-Cyclotella_meneghiniana.AAC.2